MTGSPGWGTAHRAGLVAVLVLAALGGFFLQRSLTPHPSEPAASGGDAMPSSAQPSPPGRKVLPEELPDIALPDAAGNTHRLSDWRGRPLMVNFWATWCEPCRREIPLLMSLRRERARIRLEILGIAIDESADVRTYAARQAMDYPILLGERDGLTALDAFGMDSVLPFTVFSDAKGRIIAVKVGELHRDEANLILDQIAAVDAGTVPPQTARETIRSGLRELALHRAR